MAHTLDIPVTRVQNSKLPDVDMEHLSFGEVYSDHMFVADYKDGGWQDMRIEPFADLQLSPANATLHYAQSIFEGLKAHRADNGDVLIFRPDQNARRMVQSAERMCMPPVPEEMFMEAIEHLVSLDQEWTPSAEGSSLYIRPFQFATDPFIGVRPSKKYKFIVFTGPAGSYYSEPVRVKIEKQFTRAARGGVGAAKTAGNYAASLYPALKAQEQGYTQLIWTDGVSHDYIEESGTMNIMFVIDGKLVTPALTDSILPGITRLSALELAREWGMEVEERRVSVQEIYEAAQKGTLQEAFGAGTAVTISHIKAIGFDNEDFELPPVEGREVSHKLLKTLTDIKLGRIEDTRGWTVKI